MVANMKVGTMDAFCVGEPCNDPLVNQGLGYSACVTGELWRHHPEKSLGMRADFVAKNPKAALMPLGGGSDRGADLVRAGLRAVGPGRHRPRPAGRHQRGR